MIVILYDGKCSLCRREIEYYQRIAPANTFTYEDVTVNASVIEELNISYIDALKQLHVLDPTGHVYVGVDAFILIWKQMKRWRILAAIVNFPFIRFLANIAYHCFANWRFKRLSHCQLALRNHDLSNN